MMETFHRGASFFAMARKTKKQKYQKAAKQVLKTIEKWAQHGNPNVQHYYTFLLGEQAVLSKSKQDQKNKKDLSLSNAETLYRKAIVFAGRRGYLHDAFSLNAMPVSLFYLYNKTKPSTKPKKKIDITRNVVSNQRLLCSLSNIDYSTPP